MKLHLRTIDDSANPGLKSRIDDLSYEDLLRELKDFGIITLSDLRKVGVKILDGGKKKFDALKSKKKKEEKSLEEARNEAAALQEIMNKGFTLEEAYCLHFVIRK